MGKKKLLAIMPPPSKVIEEKKPPQGRRRGEGHRRARNINLKFGKSELERERTGFLIIVLSQSLSVTGSHIISKISK